VERLTVRRQRGSSDLLVRCPCPLEQMKTFMNRHTLGLLAGFTATIPMTLAMTALHRRLPPQERYPLPPEEITAKLAEEASQEEHIGRPEHHAATLITHFGYGAMMGGVYAPLAEKIPGPPVIGGMGYGLAVWAGSYLGLLPALGILKPATEHPLRRNALMIAAHLVWGAALGALVGKRTKWRE
jgi:uncharacterized membrane protein YagU involved in acid resistance